MNAGAGCASPFREGLTALRSGLSDKALMAGIPLAVVDPR